MVTCERPTPARTNVTRLSRNAPACRFKLRMNRKSGTRLMNALLGEHSYIMHLNSAMFQTQLGRIWPTPIVGLPGTGTGFPGRHPLEEIFIRISYLQLPIQ